MKSKNCSIGWEHTGGYKKHVWELIINEGNIRHSIAINLCLADNSWGWEVRIKIKGVLYVDKGRTTSRLEAMIFAEKFLLKIGFLTKMTKKKV